jgi:hypothetical protein
VYKKNQTIQSGKQNQTKNRSRTRGQDQEIELNTLLQKWFRITLSDFDWCRLITIVGIKNNRREIQTRSQLAKKNRAGYWCRLLKLAGTKNQFLVLATYAARYYKQSLIFGVDYLSGS